MKRSILSFGLSALVISAMAQDNEKPVGGTGPMITLDKEVHDYGVVKQGADGNCTFTVTNTGDQPLIITQCQGSCGCTVPKCDTAPVKPGEKSVITVKYDTNRVGPINKNVTISSNAANSPSKVIRISGTVEASETAPVVTPAPEGKKTEAPIPSVVASPPVQKTP